MSTRPERVHPSRILIYGVTGSGKTTLAEQLSVGTGLPWYSVDDLTWAPGWVEVPGAEQRRRIAAICQQERWILDTAYGKWLDIPLVRAELVVGLDYPRWRSLSRLARRTLLRIIDQRRICNGNRETIRRALRRDSILVWHFRSFTPERRRMRAWRADPGMPEVLVFGTPRATARWLRAYGSSHHAGEQPSCGEPNTRSKNALPFD